MHHEVKLMETTTKEVFFDKLTYIYLEMPKFKKTLDELETQFDKWLYLIKNLPQLENRPEEFNDKVFDKLFLTAEIVNFTKAEEAAYEESLKSYRDMLNVVETAVMEAVVKERVKSLAEGKNIGKLEEKIEVAINLIKNGVDLEIISKSTGLSIEEINELKIKNNLENEFN